MMGRPWCGKRASACSSHRDKRQIQHVPNPLRPSVNGMPKIGTLEPKLMRRNAAFGDLLSELEAVR